MQFVEESPSSSIQLRHDQILKLEEEREKARIIHAKHQQIIKSSFDSTSSSSKQLQVGDLVLKWDKAHEDKGKHTKFQKNLARTISNQRADRPFYFHIT